MYRIDLVTKDKKYYTISPGDGPNFVKNLQKINPEIISNIYLAPYEKNIKADTTGLGLVAKFVTVILGIVGVIILFAEAGTKYVIQGRQLILCVPGRKAIINIDEIEKIEETGLINLEVRNYFAMSLDRLTITIKNGDKYIVSPKCKDKFVKELQKINPEIISKI